MTVKASLRLSAVCLLLLPAALRADKSPTQKWSDTTRDVWIDGQLDRDTQVLSCAKPRRMAVVSPGLPYALVIDPVAKTVGKVPKEAFHVAPDRATATTDVDLAVEPLCACQQVDGSSLILHVEGKTVLLYPHQGLPPGEMTEAGLFATVPVWGALAAAYQPKVESVAALAAADAETDVTVVFGTWCGDSKNYVPKLLKTLRDAGNPKLHVKLVGLSPRFQEPMELVQGTRILNVPTIVVSRNGKELGRIVETPGHERVEEDLAAILSGDAVAHRGRWERGPKVASGVYRDLASGSRERFEVYQGKDGERLVHSTIEGRGDVEVWQEVDKELKPTFAEITKRHGDRLERVRYGVDGKRLHASLRGNDSGIGAQDLAVPDRWAFLSPSTAACGLCPPGPEYAAYVAPADFDKPLGLLGRVVEELKGTESLETPAGTFQARRVLRLADGVATELWLHPELGIPLYAKLAGGREVVLTELER